MKDMGIVQGSEVQAVPLVIGKDTVYVHTDIKQTPSTEDQPDGGWEYHEIQYDKDEYILLMANQTTNLELAVVELYEEVIKLG